MFDAVLCGVAQFGMFASVVRWLCVSMGGGKTGSPPPKSSVLPLRRPRLPRRKRDCTLALFFTTSASTSATSLCTSEEEGLHTALPPRNVGMYFGGRGTSPLPHKVSENLGGNGTGPPPHNDGVYFGGRETGSRPHTDECFMCHNEQDPFLFLADMFLM